jgi:hypothetical protein
MEGCVLKKPRRASECKKGQSKCVRRGKEDDDRTSERKEKKGNKKECAKCFETATAWGWRSTKTK